MEENDLKELIEDIRDELRDDLFSKKFFVSLVKNYLFYNREKDKIYNFTKLSVLSFSLLLSQYRTKEFFKDESVYDYMRFFKLSSIELLDSDSIKGFIVLKNNIENIEYIKSISRDNKLKKIIE